MKVRVLEDRCQGQGMCKIAAPELFHLRDLDGHAEVLHSEVTGELADKARRAASTCPEYAIRVSGDGSADG